MTSCSSDSSLIRGFFTYENMKKMATATSSVEIAFYESLHARSSEDWIVIKALADSYMEAELYQHALILDEKIVLQFPNEALAHYNHACSLCRMQHLEASLGALQKAIALGYSDWDFLLSDKDLFALRQTRDFIDWAQRRLPSASIRQMF